jgi:hypothetical protein
MPNVVAGQLANAEMVARIRTDVLLEWLWPMREYFEKRGLSLMCGVQSSECGVGGALGESAPPLFDCVKLAEILREPTPDMPVELLEALHVFRALDNEQGMDEIEVESRHRGLELGLDVDATPLDAVVRAWSRDRQLVEWVHARHAVRQRHSFLYFSTDAEPVPTFSGPTGEQLSRMEEALNEFDIAWGRGPGANRQGSQPRPSARLCMQRWNAWTITLSDFRTERKSWLVVSISVLWRIGSNTLLRSLRTRRALVCGKPREQNSFITSCQVRWVSVGSSAAKYAFARTSPRAGLSRESFFASSIF